MGHAVGRTNSRGAYQQCRHKGNLEYGKKQECINDMLHTVCWKSVTFELRTIQVPGSLTGILDVISRLHETGQPERLALLVILAPWLNVILAPWLSAPPPPIVAFIPLSVSTGAAKELETALQAEVAHYGGKPLQTILNELTHSTGTLTSHQIYYYVFRRSWKWVTEMTLFFGWHGLLCFLAYFIRPTCLQM